MDRVVVITGATSGLGLDLAKRFLDLGDCVFGISKTKKNWKTAHKAWKGRGSVKLYQADVSLEVSVRRVVKTVTRKTQKIDILINNAGYCDRPTRLEKLQCKEFLNNISANLVSTFLMCREVIPIFKKQRKGLIINISSMAGKRAVPYLAAYSASKFGVLALSQSIAKENEGWDLKCITVCPGGMNTRMREKLFGRQDAKRQQSTDLVADIVMKVINNKISVESGGDIVIRHGKVTAINPKPSA